MSESFGKSWILYVLPVAGIVACGSAILVMMFMWRELKQSLGIDGPLGVNENTLVFLVPFVVVIAVAAWPVYVIAYLRTVRFTVEDGVVKFEAGIIWWRKKSEEWTQRHIFRAKAVHTPQFLGWLFRFGSIVIIENNGRELAHEPGMHRPKTLAKAINSLANNFPEKAD